MKQHIIAHSVWYYRIQVRVQRGLSLRSNGVVTNRGSRLELIDRSLISRWKREMFIHFIYVFKKHHLYGIQCMPGTILRNSFNPSNKLTILNLQRKLRYRKVLGGWLNVLRHVEVRILISSNNVNVA